jgi:luciferase-like monooxygenase
VTETVLVLDQQGPAYPVFIPDGRSGYESLETVSAILGQTRRLHAGSGVIRLMEHDSLLLARRLQTLQAFSSNRCFLGVGTGSPGPQPAMTIDSMLKRLDDLRTSFQQFPTGVEPPEVWVAALRPGISKRSMKSANGLLLNFCTPQHVSRLIEGLGSRRPKELELACYLKLFYSAKSNDTPKRLLVQEFLNYDSIPQYHQMFVQDGTAEAIASLKQTDEWRKHDFDVPKELLKVSLANPEGNELANYVESFRREGVGLPVIYPYFPEAEGRAFKLQTVKSVLDSVG